MIEKDKFFLNDTPDDFSPMQTTKILLGVFGFIVFGIMGVKIVILLQQIRDLLIK